MDGNNNNKTFKNQQGNTIKKTIRKTFHSSVRCFVYVAFFVVVFNHLAKKKEVKREEEKKKKVVSYLKWG